MEEQKLITIDELTNSFSMGNHSILEIKSYFPFGFKRQMINNIINISILNTNESEEINNDLIKIDYSLLKIARDYNIFINYTNLDENGMSMFEIYDIISEKGILQYVLKNISSNELAFIDEILEKEINQILIVDNGISAILSKNINKVINKIPNSKELTKLIKELPKIINKINPDNLKFVADTIKFNNGLK